MKAPTLSLLRSRLRFGLPATALLLLLLLSAGPSGCSGPRVIRGYAGPQIGPQQVGVVLVEGPITLWSLDGRRLWRGDAVEVAPGNHAIQVTYFTTRAESNLPARLDIAVAAGSLYRLRAETSGSQWKPVFEPHPDPTGARAKWTEWRSRPSDEPGCTPEEYFGPDDAPKKWPECPAR